MRDLLAELSRQTDDMLALLRALAEHESPTARTPDEKAACDRLATYLEGAFAAHGALVERIPQPTRGDHLIARWGDRSAARPTLILTHYDTVWPLGTLPRMPVHQRDGRLYGPGVFDMKGGLVIGLFAVRAMREQGRLRGPLTFMATSDEELGSVTSRALIEGEARQARAVLVLEPAQPPHAALKTSRKGVARFKLRVVGQSAHSGWVAEHGVSAIEELARQIVDLYALTDLGRGTTLNVGVVRGGERANVVAADAEADIDVRVMTPAEAERVTRAIHGLRPYNPQARLEVEGGLHRPPMERTAATATLFELAQRLGATMGVTVTESGSGGGSDGAFTAALGVPTLDGLGVVGAGAHGPDEHIVVAALATRAALLAGLIASISAGEVDLP